MSSFSDAKHKILLIGGQIPLSEFLRLQESGEEMPPIVIPVSEISRDDVRRQLLRMMPQRNPPLELPAPEFENGIARAEFLLQGSRPVLEVKKGIIGIGDAVKDFQKSMQELCDAIGEILPKNRKHLQNIKQSQPKAGFPLSAQNLAVLESVKLRLQNAGK